MPKLIQRLGLSGLLLLSVPGLAQEVISGLEVGSPTQSIPVLDITGAYKGRPICYVCEFQDAPNVLAFFRGTGEGTADLIVQLNELYLENRSRGFKAVAMIVAGEEAAGWLEDLNRTRDIQIPLTVFRRGPRDVAARLYSLNPEVDNTFLVTVNRFVEANLSGLRPGEFGKVVEATDLMLTRNEQVH